MINPDMANESVVILDDDGTIPVTLAYARSHPEWYHYIGHCRVNGIVVHTFRFLPPP